MENRLKRYLLACTCLIIANSVEKGINHWFFWFNIVICIIMLVTSIKFNKK
jgi:hypothetical protein